MERRLDIPPAPIAHVRALERALGVSFATAQVLVRRGLGDESVARAWLEAADRHDPSAFAEIDLAVGLVLEHVRAGTRITVHGDYDVDGVCSTAILVRALRALGAEVDWFLPSRGEDGYGLSAATVQRLGARGTRLLLTADCGITAVEEVALALASGVDVVVTDHHAPRADGTLPGAPIVHPVVCGYPCPDLCAAGVAHKFAAALLAAAGGERPASVGGPGSGAEPSGSAGDAYCADDDLDLVALATVADCVPLRGENRRLVREGLRALAVSPKPGIRALLRVAKVDPSALDARAVGFRLAPRINAAGRLYRADAGLELVLTEDPERAAAIADELDHANAERRHTETRIVFEAEAQVREAGDQPAYVLAADGWHPGVIGIVASRIAERHHRPCVLIALEGEQGTGSGRSIPTFDLLGGLHASSAHLTRHGGHRAAAGCAIARDQVDAFRAAFIAHADATLSAEDLVPTERVDAVVAGDELGLTLAEELERLAPFGIGNPAVSLLVPAARLVDPRPMGEEGRHLRFTVEAGGHRARAVAFGIGHLPDGDLHDATFALELNEWGGAVEPRLVLRHAQQPLPAPIELVGEPEDAVEAALAELAAALPPGAPSRAPGVPRDRRGGGAAGTLAALVASGEPVLVVCADAPRRRRHLEGRLGGFALVAWHALEREPSLLDAYAHVLALDPPVPDAHAALIDERFTLAWGQAETSYALLAHEAGYDLRPVAAAVYRALRAAAPTLEDVVVAAPSPAAAGRALRVLDELGLIRVDGRTAALLEARRTDLDRSAAFRAYATRLAEGRARLGAATTVQAA